MNNFRAGREILLLVLLSAITVTIYSNTLKSPFVLDDAANITENQYIRISNLGLKSFYKAAFYSLRPYRPVANISFALNYYFGGYHVFGFHIVNIFIHISTGIVLYLLLKQTVAIHPEPSLKNRWIPFWAAGLWLVHPVQTQSVTYIVQRMTSLAALFYLVAMLLYVKGRIAHNRNMAAEGEQGTANPVILYYSGAFLAGLLALCSKENAATLPVFIVLYEVFFFQNLDTSWLKKNRRYLLGVGIVFLIIGIAYTGGNPVGKILSQYKARDFSVTQRLLTESRVIVFYVSLLLFPHPSRLNLDHDFPLSFSLFNPVTTFFSIGCIAGMVVMAIAIARKERLISFCILWFLGNLVIESSVFGLEIIFEHRLYLPSMFILVVPVIIGYRCIRTGPLVAGLLCLLVILLSTWTYQRNQAWKDNITLFTDCIRKSPNKARPHIALGTAYIRAGKNREAMAVLSRAIALDPESEFAHNNYGVVLCLEGKFEQAVPHFKEAIRILPIYAEAKSNLERAYTYLAEDGEKGR